MWVVMKIRGWRQARGRGESSEAFEVYTRKGRPLTSAFWKCWHTLLRPLCLAA